MPVAKILSEQTIRKAMSLTSTNHAASRYLGVDLHTWRKYARLYRDEETGLDLYELHKNMGAKGVPRLYSKTRKRNDIKLILEGKITKLENYDVEKFKTALILDLILPETCRSCGFGEARIVDKKIPLLLNFKDGNKINWRRENVEFLCYNCYFLQVGDIFNKHQMRDIETPIPVDQRHQVDWELPDHMIEHLRELGLMDEEPTTKQPDDYTAYKDI